jgi:hypothetical protein
MTTRTLTSTLGSTLTSKGGGVANGHSVKA